MKLKAQVLVLLGWLAICLFGAKPVSAQTCAPNVVLDWFDCQEDLSGICGQHLIGRYTHTCDTSTCQTIADACTSNDTCVKVNGTCTYLSCSPGSCGVGSGIPGTNCGTDTCNPCQNCVKVDPSCIGASCERKCVGPGSCAPAPTPTPTPVPVTIQGKKVADPGLLSDANLSGIQVFLNNPSGNTSNSPFIFNFSIGYTSGGYNGSRTVSVPASAPAGYRLDGYTLCYNNWSCHTPANLQPGNSAVVSDNLLLTQNYVAGNTPYADLFWHYCKNPATPVVVPTVTAGCKQVTINWPAIAGAVSYKVYAFDGAGSYVLMANNVLTTSVTITQASQPLLNCFDTTYAITAINSCGGESPYSFLSALGAPQCPPNAPTNPNISCSGGYPVMNWTDNSNNETGFELSRTGGTAWPANKTTAANTQSYKDDVDPEKAVMGTSYNYSVWAVNNGNLPGCTDSPKISAGPRACYGPWFQVSGGDAVAAHGQIGSQLPSVSSTFFDWQAKEYSGISFGEGTTPNLNSTNANRNSWLVDITGHSWDQILNRHEIKYGTMKAKVSSRVTPYTITDPTIDTQGDFDLAIGGNNLQNKKIGGIHIWESTAGLTLGGFNVGSNKVLLFVDGNVTISGNISIGAGGMLTVMAEGDINIQGTVGDGNNTNDPLNSLTPGNLQGIYYADGILTVETDADINPDEQLVVDGSLIGMNGVILSRNNPGDNPSMLVRFNPNYTDILRQVGLRKKVMRELL